MRNQNEFVCDLHTSLVVLFSVQEIPVGTIEETRIEDIKDHPKILHVTTASSYNTSSSKETIKFMTNIFAKRGTSHSDVWLFGLIISLEETQTNQM